MAAPLADRIRPRTLDEVVGQQHIIGKGTVLRAAIDQAQVPNLIFYGPSGVGKTTIARIVAESAGKRLYKLDGTAASTADLREVFADIGTLAAPNGILLYLDEIQYLNKKQQQSLLAHIETGDVVLIASTTENPYFYIYNAILSRSTIVEFKPLEPPDVVQALTRALTVLGEERGMPFAPEEGTLELIAHRCGGDVRKALGALELSAVAAQERDGSLVIAKADAEAVCTRASMRYDRDADEHYDILSAFHKSMRGSDENAALHYLARLILAGDLISPIRRMLACASEDVGMAYPMCAVIVKACVDSALQLGLPEAQLPLAQAVVTICTAPKSNSASTAIWRATQDIEKKGAGDIPQHLKDSHYGGAKKMGRGLTYKYAHDYKNNYVRQDYLPEHLRGATYYEFGDNKTERAAREHRERLLRESEE